MLGFCSLLLQLVMDFPLTPSFDLDHFSVAFKWRKWFWRSLWALQCTSVLIAWHCRCARLLDRELSNSTNATTAGARTADRSPRDLGSGDSLHPCVDPVIMAQSSVQGADELMSSLLDTLMSVFRLDHNEDGKCYLSWNNKLKFNDHLLIYENTKLVCCSL